MVVGLLKKDFDSDFVKGLESSVTTLLEITRNLHNFFEYHFYSIWLPFLRKGRDGYNKKKKRV